jgi:hypothetical protein
MSIPGSWTDSLRDGLQKLIGRIARELFDFQSHHPNHRGERSISVGKRKRYCRRWYFINMHTGEAQWELPTREPPQAPAWASDSFIVCELRDKIPLTTMNGRYSALSYCAGRATETTKIMINGCWFNAFANLEHSIESVRCEACQNQSQNPGEEIFLWTDQICINQENHEEKSHQVAFMQKIYQRANKVLICLSTASTTTRLRAAARAGVEAVLAFSEEAFGSRDDCCDFDDIEDKELWRIIRTNLDSKQNSSLVINWITFFTHLVSAPYWTRAWVGIKASCSILVN